MKERTDLRGAAIVPDEPPTSPKPAAVGADA
jgi:hypothetical protein